MRLDASFFRRVLAAFAIDSTIQLRAFRVLCLAGVCANHTQAQNLVANGGFEQRNMGGSYFPPGSDALPGWSIGGAGINYLHGGFEGEKCIDTNAEATGSVAQQVATIVGQRYRLSFAYEFWNCPPPTTPRLLQVTVGCEVHIFACPPTSCSWIAQQVFFTATQPSTLLRFEGISGGACGAHLDAVQIVAHHSSAIIRVPEDHATIQEAIDVAADGDTIAVAPGGWPGFDLGTKAVAVVATGGPDATGAAWATVGANASPSARIEGFAFPWGDSTLHLTTGSPTINRCVFEWMSSASCERGDSGFSAAISTNLASPVIANCIIRGPFCQQLDRWYTFGIYIEQGVPKILNCTIVGNSVGVRSIAGIAAVINCIFSANVHSVQGFGDYDPRVFSSSLEDRGAPSPGWGNLFGSLRLPGSSPCIDAGNRAAFPCFLSPIDLDGRARAIDDPLMPDTGGGSPPAIDLGPYEYEFVQPQCPTDLDDGSGMGTPDGGVTIDDLLYYLNIFDAGFPAADVDDGTGMGVPDGGVTIDDLLYYLARFDAGC